VCVRMYFSCCSGRCLYQGLQKDGLCMVGTLGLSAGGKCGRGRGREVTGEGEEGR
jgi:hypothetical protein